MRMRYAITFVLAALIAAGPVTSNAAIITFHSHADQGEEVPPTGSTATGVGEVTLDTDTNVLSWSITHNVQNETAAHFHNAPVGVNGPVVVGLGVGFIKVGSQAVSDAIETAFLGGNIYLNIHSTAFPGGEIRGQANQVPTATLAQTWGRIKALYR
ncbi:MAG TPA: CHRD domain-containing protein [Candidatus Limnocylindria bacterium]|nr:CHRD domain-containing protein [Candidatus Limnocylindria bacterium]